MRYDNISPSLFTKNRKKLVSRTLSSSMIIIGSNYECIRNGDQFFPFRQSSDFFYLTGIDQEKSILILCPNNPIEQLREILFIIQPNERILTWQGKKLSKEEAANKSGIKNVKWTTEFDATINALMPTVTTAYFNVTENPSVPEHSANYDLDLKNEILKQHEQVLTENIASILTSLRLIKEPEEVEIIRKACHITKEAFSKVLQTIRPGQMEYQVEATITREFLWHGASGHAYHPIVASGQNACILHYNNNDMPCQSGDLLLLDFGAEYANYSSDCSRTIPVSGKYSKRQKQCYNAVLKVFKQAKELFVPGTTIDNINKTVGSLIEKELIDLGLLSMKEISKQNSETPLFLKYYMHGVSHFMGLDVHDVGNKSVVLEKGMVLTCEPGLYIKNENIGIRIENDILVDDYPIDLMNQIPLEADEIEEIMNS